MKERGHVSDIHKQRYEGKTSNDSSFVLDKDIFSNIFGKDIRRVYIYKKAERLAKALQMVAPAFRNSEALRARVDQLSIDLIDAAVQGPTDARIELSGHILALSSLLEIARTGSLLSPMNSDIISREARSLLQEIAQYEDPRIELGEVPTLPLLQKSALHSPKKITTQKEGAREEKVTPYFPPPVGVLEVHKGQSEVKDKKVNTNRREEILSVVKDKQEVSIKDISLLMQGISEKTVQRELQSLVQEGVLVMKGSRRWTTYSFK